MNILSLILLILSLLISINILFQEDTIKNSSLSFIKTSFFNNEIEKITFFLIIVEFFLLLIQRKFDLI